MLSVTIDRSSLGLPDLAIGDYPPASGFWIPEGGIQRPAKAKRLTYAADASWVNGSVLTASALQHSSQPLTVKAKAATTAALEALKDELEDALDQFTYNVTVTVDGFSRTHAADPADIGWGDIDSGEVEAKIASATIAIPVYPVSA